MTPGSERTILLDNFEALSETGFLSCLDIFLATSGPAALPPGMETAP